MAKAHNPKPLARWDYLAAGAVFAAAMVLYTRTLATQLLLGDSGEYQTLGYTLGLAHPTGYPVYILVARLVTLLLPVKDIAYRVNWLSALSGAVTLALVYLLGVVLAGRRSAALVGAAALGSCRLFWWHAVIAEVYDPAAMLVALVLLLVVLWRRTADTRLLFWAGFAGGLSLGVHYTVLLVAPAVLLFMALAAPAAGRRAAWVRAAGGCLLGTALCLVAFLGLDAYNPPSSNANAVLKPSLSVLDITAGQFASPLGRIAWLATGKQFHGQLFSLPQARVIENARVYARTLREQFPPAVLALAAFGLVALFLRRRDGNRGWREGLLLLIAWAAMVAYVIDYDIGDYFVFYIPGYVLLAAAAGAGAAALLDLIIWLAGRLPALAGRPAIWVGELVGLALVASALLPMAPAIQRSWQLRRITFLDGTDWQYYPYPVRDPGWPQACAGAIVARLEDNAIVFTDWGMLYPIYYIAHVEQGRTGISAHETYPAMEPRPFAASALAYVRANWGQRPIYFTAPDDLLAQSYRFVRVRSDPDLFRLEARNQPE